jgi:hypothetical protein
MNNGAIAFLDILGFKGMWQKEKPEKVLSIMQGVLKRVEKTYKQPPPEKGWPESKGPDITILSDTIVVGFRSEHPACLALIATVIYDLIHYFLEFNMFFRGAVGYGQYVQKGNIFLGPVIDDVASWYQAANWIGVVSTPRTNYFIDRLSINPLVINSIFVPFYAKYDVPDKKGSTYRLNCLNWPAYLQASCKNIPQQNKKSEVRQLIEKAFTKQYPFSANELEKYENTLKFIDFCVSKMEKDN